MVFFHAALPQPLTASHSWLVCRWESWQGLLWGLQLSLWNRQALLTWAQAPRGTGGRALRPGTGAYKVSHLGGHCSSQRISRKWALTLRHSNEPLASQWLDGRPRAQRAWRQVQPMGSQAHKKGPSAWRPWRRLYLCCGCSTLASSASLWWSWACCWHSADHKSVLSAGTTLQMEEFSSFSQT